MNRSSSGDVLAGGFALLIVLAFLAVIVALVGLTGAMLTELVRVYAAYAVKPSTTTRVLWSALLGFCLVLLAAFLVASASPALAVPALYACAWSFLAFVLVIESCSFYEYRQEQHRLKDGDALDAYLDDFSPLPLSATTTNRHKVLPGLPSTNGRRIS